MKKKRVYTPEQVARKKALSVGAWGRMTEEQRVRHRAASKASRKRRYTANPRQFLDAQLRHQLRRVGIDPATVPPRPDSCQVCGRTLMVCFDHCHKTNKFRGWLCGSCNRALGMVADNPETLRKLADYLESK